MANHLKELTIRAVGRIMQRAAEAMLDFDVPEQRGDAKVFAAHVGCAYEVWESAQQTKSALPPLVLKALRDIGMVW